MCALKYIGTFFGGFICAAILVWLVILPQEDKAQFDYGFTNGELRGQMDVVDTISKEFGFYSGHSPHKVLLDVKERDLISFETNGVKTVGVVP
jgi:hypothetical protein